MKECAAAKAEQLLVVVVGVSHHLEGRLASRAVELGRFCHGALCQEEPRPVPGNITIHTLNLAVSRPMGLGFLLAYEGGFVEIEPGTSADQGKAEARERLGHQRRVVAAIIELGDVLIGGIAHY
jgi:hypothetical protein